MKEYKIEIKIDEKGMVYAESKGIFGDACIDELDVILKGLEGDRSHENKSEFYQKTTLHQRHILNR